MSDFNLRSGRNLAAAAFVVSLCFGAAARAQDCQLKEIASLDMKIDAYGGALIPVALDDTPHAMLVDTGAQIGMLSPNIADDLGLKRQSMLETRWTFSFSSGTKATQYVVVPSLKIGPDEAKNTDFLIAKGPIPFDGTVAYDILHNFDVDFDFANGKLNLFSPDHCPGKVVYWAGEYTDVAIRLDSSSKQIAVTMSLDGHDVDAIIDTGASETILTLPAAKQTFGLDVGSPGMVPVGAGTGNDQVYRYRFKTLSLSGITVNNPLITLIPDAVGEQARRDLNDSKMQGYQGTEAMKGTRLILGMDVLRRLHFYIAYKEQKIYVTAVDAH